MKLEIVQLGKYFGHRWVFREVDFGPVGGIVGIAGANGSGKSTLMRCLAGLLRQDYGEIRWTQDEGDPVDFEMRRDSGFAAPYIQLYKDLTCRENLEFLKAPFKVVPGNALNYDAMFVELGIEEKIDVLYKSLSSGQQQRVKIIASVLNDPSVLFLDEPGTNLDIHGVEFIKKLVEDRKNRQRLTIIASNDPAELEWCDTVLNIETINK